MKKRIFTGAATALITPMKADGSVNFERLETLVDEQVKAELMRLLSAVLRAKNPRLIMMSTLRLLKPPQE